MTIISLEGHARSGKDTVASFIQKECVTRGLTCANTAFATPIKDACEIIFGWNRDHTYGSLKEVVDSRWGISPRKAMQWLGTEVMQQDLLDHFPELNDTIGRSFWCYRWALNFESLKHNDVVTLSDGRFVQEVEFLKKFGIDNSIKVVLIKVSRESLDKTDIKYSHASETAIDSLPFDVGIPNNGTLEELELRVKEVMSFIRFPQENPRL